MPRDTGPSSRIRIRQPENGYRYSMDAVLLAEETQLKPGNRVLDMGTGCGVIALILAEANPDAIFFGIELQPDLVEIARENVVENHMADRITIFREDIRHISPASIGGPVDVVVCNPPHTASRSGRLSPFPRIAEAKHEITVCLKDVINAAARMLSAGGRFILIYPAVRMAAVFAMLHQKGIEPKNLRMVHTKPDTEAKRFIIEAVVGARPGLTVAPPIIFEG